MASSSSSSFQSWNHDVFLSFRGSDTFVDHLYSATYKDDQTLDRGETIGPSPLKAIEESQIAVIILSENYADFSWYLDELAYIMKCKNERGQIVMPIFYQIDPSEVRKQKRKYGEAFAKYDESEKKKVESWINALTFLDGKPSTSPMGMRQSASKKLLTQFQVDFVLQFQETMKI